MCSIELRSGNKHFIGGIWNNISPYVSRKKTIIRVEYICGGGGSVSVSELAGNMVRPLVVQKLGTTIFRLALLKSLAIIKILSGWRDCRLLIKKTSWLLYSVLVLVLGKMYTARTMTPVADKTSVFCCDVLFVAERSGAGDADTGQWWFMGSHLAWFVFKLFTPASAFFLSTAFKVCSLLYWSLERLSCAGSSLGHPLVDSLQRDLSHSQKWQSLLVPLHCRVEGLWQKSKLRKGKKNHALYNDDWHSCDVAMSICFALTKLQQENVSPVSA